MVSLVGAGPGDPGLITVKGLRALQAADVVLYDRLANSELLAEAPGSALLIDVGKAPGDPNQTPQERINALLVQYGAQGLRVVRLKGGDPYVFGRGSEEAAALADHGIDYEVIPGISSAIAGPGAAGIPVTHRGVATAFGVFTAHTVTQDGSIPWAAAAQLPTAVFLMGVERLPEIVSRLRAHGRDPQTPAAIIANATLPTQQVVVGTLATLAERAEGIRPPAVIVVGDVVGLSGTPEVRG